MLIEELGLHGKTLSSLKKRGYETAEEIADAYINEGNKAFTSRAVKDSVVPILENKGILPSLPSVSELEESRSFTLIGIKDAAETVKMDPETLRKLTEDGKIPRTHYFIRGVDITTRAQNVKYLYDKEKFLAFMNKYSSLSSISKELNISKESLAYLLEKELNEDELREIRLSFSHWDEKWVKENYLDLIQSRTRNNKGKGANYTDLFNDELNELIEEYFDYRTKNDEISFDGVVYFSQRIKKLETAEGLKTKVNRLIYKILCGRASIENFWVVPPKSNSYRDLTAEEEMMILETKFNPIEFNEEDARSMTTGLNSDTAKWKTASELKPFLYYALMKAEDEFYKKLEDKDRGEEIAFNSIEEKERLFRMKRRIDKALKTDIPVKEPRKVKSSHKKVFATRTQLVKTFHSVLYNQMSHTLRSPVKYAAILLIGFLAGIRPVELWKLKIDEHLDIEKDPSHPEFGLLKKYRIERINGMHSDFRRTIQGDLEGWSRLWISEDISKGTYSPSPEYGTLLVPRLTDCINQYLKWLYSKTPEQLKAKGFLFRSDDKNPYDGYSKVISLTKWLWRIKRDFEGFLSEEEIKNFSYYETRHTVNNLIVNRTLIKDPQLNEWRKRVAEVHCRHEIQSDDKSKSRINEFHYQEDVPLWAYYSVIKNALDFPFSLERLSEWEKENNPLGVTDAGKENPEVERPHWNPISKGEQMPRERKISTEEKRLLEEIETQVEVLNAEYDIVKHPVKAKTKYGLEGKERRARLTKIKQQIDDLRKRQSKIKEGEAS